MSRVSKVMTVALIVALAIGLVVFVETQYQPGETPSPALPTEKL